LSVAALLACLAGAGLARAHYVSQGIGSAIQVVIEKDRVRLTYDLGFSAIWARAEMLSIDTDKDFAVSESEAEAYRAKAWEKTIAPYLKVVMNGVEAPLRLVSSRSETLPGEVGLVPFDVYYEIDVEIPFASPAEAGKVILLEILNRTLEKDATNPPLFFIPYAGHGSGCSYSITEPRSLADLLNHIAQGPKLKIRFECSGGDLPTEQAKLAGAAASPSPPAEALPPREASGAGAASGAAASSPGAAGGLGSRLEERDAGNSGITSVERILQDLAKRPELGVWVLLSAAFIAFIAGAGHALQPGHGKTMVAAYLIGSRGRIREAVFLGAVVTFTHTFSVYLLGILIYGSMHTVRDQTLQDRYLAVFSIIGGLMLLGMGLWLFRRRVRWAGHPERMKDAAHEHRHSHGPFGHAHGHSHLHSGPAAGGHWHAHGDGAAARSRDHGPEMAPPAAAPLAPAGAPEPEPGRADAHGERQTPGTATPAAGAAPPPVAAPSGPSPGPSYLEMLYLGVSGGIAPCPGGLMVLSIGLLYPERFGYALALLVLYSLGLGSVLVAIGVFLVTGRTLLLKVSPRREYWMSYLPTLSALFITALGAFYLVANFRTYRKPISDMLLELAHWLRQA
jgi:ABC-type nickel/cobalt efflux system permease component RcnA